MYAFLLLLHFAIKDSVYPLSIIFYASPLILIILFGVITTFLYYRRKKIFYCLILLLSLLMGYWFSNHYILPKTLTNTVKSASILFWNIAKNDNGFPNKIVSKKMEEFPINILAFVETNKVSVKQIENIEAKYSNYTFKKLKGNMIIGDKGKIESVT